MKNWKHPPTDPQTARYVDCYWFLQKNRADISNAHPRLYPDAGAHLIFTPTDQPWHYTLGDRKLSGCGNHLILPQTGSMTLHHAEPFVIVGVRFRVGALYSLVQSSLPQPLNRVISPPDCFSAKRLRLPDSGRRSDTEDDTDATCAELDRWLAPLLATAHEDRHSRLVRTALSLLEDTRIADLDQRLHCSRRTIERSFQRVTGLTLKQYCSMQTLDRLLSYLYRHKDSLPDWAEIAARFGFSDQPHLIRNLKNAINATPGDYLKRRDLTIDVYGDFE